MAMMVPGKIGMRPATPAEEAELQLKKLQQQSAQPPAAAPVNNIADPNSDPERFKTFGTMRNRAQQQGAAAKTEQGEALKRRFAQLGNVGSGAYIKAATIADKQADRATAEAVQNVDMAEQQERGRLKDVQEERTYQAGEAEKLRIFNRELFDKDQAFKQVVFSDESKARWKQLDLAFEDLKESKKSNEINALIALLNADADPRDVARQSNALGAYGYGPQAGKVAYNPNYR